MFSQDDDGHGLVLAIVFGLIALVMTVLLGLVIHQRGRTAPPPAKAAAIAVSPAVIAVAVPVSAASAASAAQEASDAASIKVENGVVRFYFAPGKSDLAAGAADALTDVVKAAKAGSKLAISGFHDATGNAAKNAELAKQRATAVRDALKAAGVSDSQMQLRRPEQTEGAGSNAESRRVEVAPQ
ncbi:MAG: OmpA family protein [Pseudomonadota bacterium]